MNAHILLVEDDDTLRKLLDRILSKSGYEVTQASDGATAITLLEQASATGTLYDVVLTDIVMPNIDGLAVTIVARERYAAPEVILLTGHGSLDTAMSALRQGAFDYLLKPVETALLLIRIAAAVEQRQTRLEREREAAGLRTMAQVLAQVQAGTLPEAPQREPTRTGATEAPRYLAVGALRIDTHRHEAWLGTTQVRFTPTEYAIVICMAESAGQVMRYEDIIQRTHGQSLNHDEAHSLIASHMRNIRRKIPQGYLISIRSVGYMLTEPDGEGPVD